MKIKVTAEESESQVDQWCEIVREKEDGSLLVRRLGDDAEITISPRAIRGVQLTKRTSIGFTAPSIRRSVERPIESMTAERAGLWLKALEILWDQGSFDDGEEAIARELIDLYPGYHAKFAYLLRPENRPGSIIPVGDDPSGGEA